jgi:hypothetical protein
MSRRGAQQEWLQRLESQTHFARQGVLQTIFYARNRQPGPAMNRPGVWVHAQIWDWTSSPRPDFRSVLWNELLFDFDHPRWRYNWAVALRLDRYLNDKGMPHYWFASGGKGLHCSLFMDAGGEQARLGWKHLRISLWNRICREAGVSSDPAKVHWNDSTMGSLVRAEGGLRYERPQTLDTWEESFRDGLLVLYKHWLDRPPKEKPFVTRPGQVEYPPAARLWRIPVEWLPEPEPQVQFSPRPMGESVQPLIRKLTEFMLSGGNLPDYGRFAVACYLLRAGWTVDEAVDVYRPTPNFNERVTRSRLEQLQRDLDHLSIPGRRAILERLGNVIPGLSDP